MGDRGEDKRFWEKRSRGWAGHRHPPHGVQRAGQTQLQDGKITVKPLRFHTARGDVDLTLHFNPFTTDSPPRLRAAIDVRHVDLHELLRNGSSEIVKKTGG